MVNGLSGQPGTIDRFEKSCNTEGRSKLAGSITVALHVEEER